MLRVPCRSASLADGHFRPRAFGCFPCSTSPVDTRLADALFSICAPGQWFPNFEATLDFGSLNKACLRNSRYAEGPFYALRGRVISGILCAGLVPRLGGPEGVVAHRNNTFVPGVLVCLAVKLWRSHAMRPLKPPQSTGGQLANIQMQNPSLTHVMVSGRLMCC